MMAHNNYPPFSCPRRLTVGNLLDEWHIGTSFGGYEDDQRFHHCSYCGSMNPDELLGYIREGWYVIPTDKSYKIYVGVPLQEPQIVSDNYSVDHKDVGKFYFQHLSIEQRTMFLELYNSKKMKLGYPGFFYTKPYFASKVSA